MKTVSVEGENATKVLIPQGWGDRICTLILTLTPLTLVKKIGIVFRGRGKRMNKEEQKLYDSLPYIQVFFQSKAWVDKSIEMEVTKTILIPHCKEVRRSYEAKGEKFPGILDVEDNFSAHTNAAVLETKIKNGILPMFLQAGTTDASQHVDNNNGKETKRDISRKFQTFLEKFDFEANPTGKFSLRERRMTMAKFVNEVVAEWDTLHPNLVKSSAIQCGMAMAIDGTDRHLIQPPLYSFFMFTGSRIYLRSLNRYPPDFGATLQPGHALYDVIHPYVPVIDPASLGQRTRAADPVFVENADTTVIGDVGLFDGDEDAEEDIVLGLDEVPVTAADVEEAERSVEESQSDSEAIVVSRARKARRRYCLEDCVCEKQRGRLCECEKHGDGMCSDECQCNPAKCRASPKDVIEGEESSDSDSEESDD
jgi:hypothetical protein